MRRILTFATVATAVVMTAVAVFLLTSLPPRALRPAAQGNRQLVALGAYHVHSSRSDGSGTIEEIASAAAEAGLDFVVLTDHGAATGAVQPPRYVDGVLMIDAVEINTDSGHVVAMDLQRASDYPLAGDARDVVEDIHRLGGWAVAGHPDSPRPNLRWRGQLAVDGLEWLNVDSEWRSHSGSKIAATAGRAIFRGPESIASLFRAPSPGLARWDAMLRGRASVTLAAVDAHARLGGDEEGWGSAASVSIPSYTTLFRTVSQVVLLASPLSGQAQSDGRALQDALRAGRTYSIVRAFADVVPAINFQAVTRAGAITMGTQHPAGSDATLTADVPAIPAARVNLLHDGRVVQSGSGRVQMQVTSALGTYRAEAYLPGGRVPWLVTNPIYFRRSDESRPSAAAARVPEGTQVPASSWRIEADPSSRANLDAEQENVLRWTYNLGGGTPAGQYVALASDASGASALDRIVITATAPKPLRVSLQVRVPSGRNGRRWRKSLYFDAQPRTYVVALSDLEPVERGSALRPIVAKVQSVLLVMDTVNATPGASGVMRITDVRLITAPPGAGRQPGG